MRRRHATVLFLLLAVVAAVPAAAQDRGPVTGSIGYTQFDSDVADLGAVTGRLGYDFTPNFGVEGEASIGVRDDDVTIAGVDGSLHQPRLDAGPGAP